MTIARPLILAIDQGSSATKALLMDESGGVQGSATAAITTRYPQPGWVEHSADDIAESVRSAVRRCVPADLAGRVVGVGMTNQRESMVLWEAATLRPVSAVISWQDRRTAAGCVALADYADTVRQISGLPLDPMFSARAKWLLDQYDPDRTASRRGELRLGTVDSWLMMVFTGEHVAEIGNASRTQLLAIDHADWSEELLAVFDVPRSALGRLVSSTGPFRPLRGLAPLADGCPVGAVVADSHAALFAHRGWQPGVVKATYGTGSSVMALGDDRATTRELCRTVAWDLGAGPVLALEGNILSSGATLSWLSRLLSMSEGELAARARTERCSSLHLVPAFNGLGAPWWDGQALGIAVGLSFDTGVAELARAAIDSIAFQVDDVMTAMTGAREQPSTVLLADGGATKNAMLMQMQADLTGIPICRAAFEDLSAGGAADMCGLSVGLWDHAHLDARPIAYDKFVPEIDDELRREWRLGWHGAVARARVRANDTASSSTSSNA